MATAVATVTSDWQVSLSTDDAGPGAWWRVSYDAADVMVSTAPNAVDRWAPLNVPLVYYWAPDAGAPVQSNEVTVTADHPVLSSTLYAGSLPVVVESQAPSRWEANSVVHTVIGRPERVVSVAPMEYPNGRLRLYAVDRRRRLNLLSLLRAGDPLILRAPCPDAVDDMTIAVQSVQDPLLSESQKAGPRWIEIDYRAVSDLPADWASPPAWTWGDMEDTYASWAEVEAAFDTWAAAEAGP